MIVRRRLFLAILLATVGCPWSWAGSPPRVRVLTYNIHHGQGTDGRLDLARIAAVIRRLKADLVALQEVDRRTRRSRGTDQAAELGRLTGMHVAFGKAMDYAGGEYGEAVLSRYALLETKNHTLPKGPGSEPRAALAIRVRLGRAGPELQFVGTHLDHASEEARYAQARLLNETFGLRAGTPAVLAGDLNAVASSRTIEALLQHFRDAGAPAPQPTWPSHRPRARIDYVLFRPRDAWRVVQRRVVDERVASDHRPLLVVLEYRGRLNP